MDFTTEIEVDVPVEAAFAYYCDQSSIGEWIPGGRIKEFSAVTPPPKQRGSRFRMVYRCMGVSFSCILELAALEHCRVSIKRLVEGDYKDYEQQFHFRSIDAGHTHIHLQVKVIFKWGWLGALTIWMMGPLVLSDLQGGLRRFKAGAERRFAQAVATASTAPAAAAAH
ncbi:MAG: SRPBCC family protein [Myxococcales bacterium]|nr:SRPBCC family protein [Myxococcales bacterium]